MAYAFNEDKSKVQIDEDWSDIITPSGSNYLKAKKIGDFVFISLSMYVQHEYSANAHRYDLGVLPEDFRPLRSMTIPNAIDTKYPSRIYIGTDGTIRSLIYGASSSMSLKCNVYANGIFPLDIASVDE